MQVEGYPTRRVEANFVLKKFWPAIGSHENTGALVDALFQFTLMKKEKDMKKWTLARGEIILTAQSFSDHQEFGSFKEMIKTGTLGEKEKRKLVSTMEKIIADSKGRVKSLYQLPHAQNDSIGHVPFTDLIKARKGQGFQPMALLFTGKEKEVLGGNNVVKIFEGTWRTFIASLRRITILTGLRWILRMGKPVEECKGEAEMMQQVEKVLKFYYRPPDVCIFFTSFKSFNVPTTRPRAQRHTTRQEDPRDH